MATLDEARTALETFAEKLNAHPNPPALTRILSCALTDLRTGFHAEIQGGRVGEILDGENSHAEISLTTDSDTLVELSNGKRSLTSAWSSGAVKLDASFMDLLKLRQLM